MYLAEQNISLVTLSLLWGFNFQKALNGDGSEIEPDLWHFDAGITVEPYPFKVNVSPRSPGHAEVICARYVTSRDTFAKFEIGLKEE